MVVYRPIDRLIERGVYILMCGPVDMLHENSVSLSSTTNPNQHSIARLGKPNLSERQSLHLHVCAA